MIQELKKQLEARFKEMSNGPLFYIGINRDEIWEQYLSGFESGEARQDKTCNACKSFLRQYAGICSIKDNKVVSIWDSIDVPEYNEAISNLKRYVQSRPITDVFLSESKNAGTNKNVDSVRNCTWEHMYLEIPKTFVNTTNRDTVLGSKRDSKNTLYRALKELTIDATETILELIAQNSLYRGSEFKNLLTEFLKIQKKFKTIPVQLQENFCWVTSISIGDGINKIRNTSIGTLLIDLSEGLELDAAVSKFERVVAPSNYKRPTSLVTPKMIEQAKEKLKELGLEESLERRFAQDTDVKVEDVLYIDKSSSLKDVFAEMSEDTPVNVKTLSKIEEISMEDFVSNVLPTAKSVDVLPQNEHLGNFVSLITAINPEAPSPFKWNNNFSWNYTGGITDSMKERVKAAGGNVTGVLRFSIQWNEDTTSICDLDAHAVEPDGTHIYFSSYKGRETGMSGMLDVDMIRPRDIGVENITWTDLNKMKEGNYKFYVHNFDHGRHSGFRAQIEMNGELHEFVYPSHFNGNKDVAIVNYSKTKGFTIKPAFESTSTVLDKEKWGIKTNRWRRVRRMMVSPNHWTGETGNKHYFMFLEGCVSDETPRPFFNEFLKQELDENRKVFEILGSKVRVQETPNQLSGLGFSTTQKSHVYVKVAGKFNRILKVNI